MKCLLFFVVSVGLLMGTWAQINVLHPECDSPEAEEAALAAQDYLNSQHTHGYKYALNRIEDVKIITKPDGDKIYVMEIDLLETDCHVLDPTPVANCTVRSKVLTSVEGDCDVVLNNVNGALMVSAFKCKTEESREDFCLGCPTLLSLNDTTALDFVQASLVTFNNITENVTFSLLEVGRMSSQIVSGGAIFLAEYVVVEANCTEDVCEPLNDAMASRGICTAKGLNSQHTVDCKMFPNLIAVVDGNSTAPVAPAVHVHTDNLSQLHGLRHHKLKALHDPLTLLSAESAESVEVVQVFPAPAADLVPATDSSQALPAADPAPVADLAPAAGPAPVADPAPAADPAPVVDPAPAADLITDSSNSKHLPEMFLFKRDVAASAAVVDTTAVQAAPVPLVPVCPGRIRFFD